MYGNVSNIISFKDGQANEPMHETYDRLPLWIYFADRINNGNLSKPIMIIYVSVREYGTRIYLTPWGTQEYPDFISFKNKI
jgi:hypothetical protein